MIEAAIMCLALNIYFEARSEPIQGQIAVAEVTLNRVASEKHPDTICGVVKQSNKNGCAFSWYCDDNSDKPKEKEAFKRAKILSEMLIKNSKYIYVLGDRRPHILFRRLMAGNPLPKTKRFRENGMRKQPKSSLYF